MALLLAAATVAILMSVLATGTGRDSVRTAGQIGLFLSTGTAAMVLLWQSGRREAWVGTRLFAGGIFASTLVQGFGLLHRTPLESAAGRVVFSSSVGVLLVTVLAVLIVDFFEHIHRGKAALLSDALLVAILTGGMLYLLLHNVALAPPVPWAIVVTALIAVTAVLALAGWGVLTLWCPTPAHLSLFGITAMLGTSAIAFDRGGSFGWPPSSLLLPEMTMSLSLILLAGVLVLEPSLTAGGPREPRAAWWIRPVLLGLSLCAACAVLLVSVVVRDTRLTASEAVVLALTFLGTVGLRAVLNQAAMVRSSMELERALADKDAAIASLRAAGEIVATSEARHRLFFESAVDGVVELDADGTIVRANAAFCAMARLPMREVVGRRWEEMAVRSRPGGESLRSLPETGEAILVAENGTSYLEARTSVLPTSPPGRLLLIRDVTSNKAAEQTIRSLFQFLQDRDEDRTRLLQRTNAAIEAERNRIARDLHDGPIQGISGAALSLEAVKLMIETSDAPGAAAMLHTVSAELSDEAKNLRQIMSDLRPPVLEQRGLIPAVRELCARMQRELEIPVTVEAGPSSEIPSDVETLAYRVIQEAMSNVAKHAAATEVEVRLEAVAGTLNVEVSDDGRGFDPADTREFLRAGKVGLASMRERAELAGGTLTLKSGPGRGTSVRASLPFEILASAPRAR
jgi:PAS domain S-box-containing protein